MTDRQLLALLCHFLVTKQFVQGEWASIKDMVTRYKSPPFTMAYPISMRLSVKDYNQLNELLDKANELLSATDALPTVEETKLDENTA